MWLPKTVFKGLCIRISDIFVLSEKAYYILFQVGEVDTGGEKLFFEITQMEREFSLRQVKFKTKAFEYDPGIFFFLCNFFKLIIPKNFCTGYFSLINHS